MKRGKIISIEGTDCSGKETQSKLLVKRMNEMGIKTVQMQYPAYDSPTGRIVGGPYLGKLHICEGYFPEGASNVDPRVASLYYAADRKYNSHKITEQVNAGINVVLDRYIGSNMAHQAGKISGEAEQDKMIEWLEELEYELLELPKPDMTIFLHMPYEASMRLKAGREERPDQHEADEKHLLMAEKTYLKLAKRYGYDTISCVDAKGCIKTIEKIATEIEKSVLKRID